MARKGKEPRDIRSETERVKPRSAGVPKRDAPKSAGPVSEAVLHYHSRSMHGEGVPASPQHPPSLDRELQHEILSRLSAEPGVVNCDVVVEVKDRVAFMTGSADTLNTKYRIEEIVSRIEGIERIENNLSIRVGEAFEEFSRSADATRLRDQVARAGKRPGGSP